MGPRLHSRLQPPNLFSNRCTDMGQIIKKEEQSEVTSAPLNDELQDRDAPHSTSSRIPNEKVNAQGAPDRPSGPVAKGPVLEADQTRPTRESVHIEPVAPKRVPSPTDPSTEPEDEEENESDDEDAEEADERAEPDIPEHVEEAIEDARVEGYEKGYSEGYDDGYDEAEQSLRAEWEEERETLIDDTNRFETLWAQYIDENESRMVELTLQLAEAIVDAPLTDSLRSAAEEAIIEAVAELAVTPPITITVHPVDYKRLQESGLADHLTEKYEDLQLESDPDRVEGDWTVASPAGAIRRRRSEVIDTLRSRLRLPGSEES